MASSSFGAGSGSGSGDRLKRIWDPTYTLVYQESHKGPSNRSCWSVQFVSRHLGTDRLPKGELIQYLQKKAKVRGSGFKLLYHK